MALPIKITFDPAFDGAAVVDGALAVGQAEVGVCRFGPLGLLGWLETVFGLGGPVTPEPMRVAEFAKALPGHSGFWDASSVADPLSTARELLRWRDELWMMGWRGQGQGPRLRQLAAGVAGAPPGIPDRLLAVLNIAKAGTHLLEPTTIRRVLPQDDLPALWVQVFAVLAERHGVLVEDVALTPARPADIPMTGDDAWVLLRPQTAWEAGEHVAAWLKSGDHLDGTVIIGATPELDDALARHGLPTSGAARQGAAANLLSNLMPLILAVGEQIPDPDLTLELLTLADQPLPPATARRLAAALHEFPGIGHAQWSDKIKAAVAAVTLGDDVEAARDKLGHNITSLFSGDLPIALAGCSRLAVAARVQAILLPWLGGRIAKCQLNGTDALPYAAVYQQAKLLLALLQSRGDGALAGGELRRLLADCMQASVFSSHTAQAGLRFIGDPGALAAPVRRVVWWNFTADTIQTLRALPLNPDELKELKQQGIDLHAHLDAQAAAQAQRWQRPIEQGREKIILVAPQLAIDGTAAALHPLWDDISAKISTAGGDPSRLERTGAIDGAGLSRDVAVTGHPQARRRWAIGGGLAIAPREKESPSGLEALLGCPFRWVMNYVAKVKSGVAAPLPSGNLLDGKLFHEIMNQIAGETFSSAADAAERALSVFDHHGSTLAAALFRPGAEAKKATFRLKLQRSVNVLFEKLFTYNSAIEASECDLPGTVAGYPMTGRADLLLRNPPAIVDFKNGGEAGHEKDLRIGMAVQLVAYAHLYAEARGVFPVVAYFILTKQRLLPSDHLLGIAGVLNDETPPMSELWKGLETAYAEAFETVKHRVTAAGVADAEGEVITSNMRDQQGGFQVKPPCDYCDYDLLCGHCLVAEGMKP